MLSAPATCPGRSPGRLSDRREGAMSDFRLSPGRRSSPSIALVSERWTLPALCLAAVVSALVGGLLFDELGPGQAALGLAIQVIATVVVAC